MRIIVTIWHFVISQTGFKFNISQESNWHFVIEPQPSSNWILKHGYWDDSGEWVDSEIWRDS